MKNPDIGRRPVVDARDSQAVSLEDFSLSSVVWNKEGNNGEYFAEAENEIIIAGKIYSCKFEMWRGNNIREMEFVLAENKNYKDWVLKGVVKFDSGTKHAYTPVYTSIARNAYHKDKQKVTLPDGTGIIFYRKMLEYIEEESAKYAGGLLHKVIHDPNLGLDSEKWNKIFEPFLTERGYVKVTDGNWRRLYRNKK